MDLGLTMSVFRRELLALPRRRHFYWKRTAVVIIGGVVVVWGLLLGDGMGSRTIGLSIFMSVSILTLLAMVIMAPTAAASLINREKDERTLGLLLISDITGWRFVLGKLATSMFSTLMTILSILPIFLLVVSLGGVSSVQVATAFVILLGAVLAMSSMGVMAASLTRTERGSDRLLGLLWACYCLGLPLVSSLPYFVNAKIPPDMLGSALSPFWAMTRQISGVGFMPGLMNLGFNIIISLPMLYIAQAFVPRLATEKMGGASDVKGGIRVSRADRRRISVSFRVARPWITPPPITGNPVTWKDFQFYYSGHWGIWMKFIVFVAGMAGIFALICLKTDMEWGEAALGYTMTMFFISLIIMALASVNYFGMMFSRERKSRALEVLLTSGLTDREIVWGKVGAVMLAVVPWATCVLVVGLLALILTGGIDPSVLIAMVVEFLVAWYAFACLAMWLSLRLKKNAAMGICILVWILWNTIGRMISVSFLFIPGIIHMTGFVMVLFDVVLHVGMGTFFLLRVLNSFREMALRNLD